MTTEEAKHCQVVSVSLLQLFTQSPSAAGGYLVCAEGTQNMPFQFASPGA